MKPQFIIEPKKSVPDFVLTISELKIVIKN